MAFSPDGKTLASGARSTVVILWDVDKQEIKELFEHTTHSSYRVSLSPDGKTLASGAHANTIYLWDTQNREETVVLTRNEDWESDGWVSSMSFSPDGMTLASGTHDGTLRLWDLSYLYDTRSIDKKIKEAEKAYNLELVGMSLQPIPPKRNLYGPTPQPPRWPKHHPFHWLSKAENGNADAMVELGIIYDRDNELEKAHHWYSKAITAGSARGKERMKIFTQWLTLHKKKFPEAYEKYIGN
ncbi:MAG: hypothetical protein GY765_01345 [bacterium]|nr:hypothetical protein [bacterium]